MDATWSRREPGDADVSWVVWARRDAPRDGDLLNMIKLTDSGGRILHVGAASGPPLYPGRLLNISYQWQRGGTAGAAGRGWIPAVRRLGAAGAATARTTERAAI